MLTATPEEHQRVIAYFESQADGVAVTMAQKVYSETIINAIHDVWDIHADGERWWVITGPITNLYTQDQFPNMDLALTFHVGLCIRVPRSERQRVSDIPAEPFAAAVRAIHEAHEALAHAEEVADYQAIGVRCREALLAFVDVAQDALPWESQTEPAPKRADLKAWAEHICAVALPGSTHENRRHLFKFLLENAWKFSNWVTHASGTRWHDAEAAVSITDLAFSLCTSAVIQHLRGVPSECPVCGSHRLSPERGTNTTLPGVEWERPTCDKCGWKGEPVPIENMSGELDAILDAADQRDAPDASGECIVPTLPLKSLRKP